MSRGVGGIDALRSLLPPWAIDAFAVFTTLGDTAFLLAIFLALYWFYDRDRGAIALAVFLGGVLTITGLKTALGLPRPPESLHVVAEDGYGFPSGHAFGATVGFGLLALVLRTPRRSLRVALAAAAVLIVSASRVVIGVHYTVDIAAGIAVGLAYLAVAWHVAWPRRSALVDAIDRAQARVLR
ncbi:MAG: phosphatase PAP2 family protein [Halobacteriales archaeon]